MPPAPSGPPPVAPIARQPLGQEEDLFVARKIFVRGFVEYDDKRPDIGIKFEEARVVLDTLKSRLNDTYKSWICPPPEDLYCPRYRNRQLIVNLRDNAPMDAAAIIARQWSDAAKGRDDKDPIRWQGREIYATRDRRLCEKQRNSALFRAKTLLEKRAPENTIFRMDWPAGLLFVEAAGSPEALLGSYGDDGWHWKEDRLQRLVSKEAAADLVEAMTAR
jgi:hypothetical protein